MSKEMFDRATGEWVPEAEYYARKAERSGRTAPTLPCPTILGDIPEYLSPLGTGLITSRSQRREELKRNNCREVDPSEFKPTYINPKNKAKAEALGKASS